MTASFHLYLDSATRSDIERVLPNPLVYGVTTNPTLMRRAALSRAALPDFVGAVLGLGARVVHVQVEAVDSPSILRDARASLDLASPGRIIPKIPGATSRYQVKRSCGAMPDQTRTTTAAPRSKRCVRFIRAFSP